MGYRVELLDYRSELIDDVEMGTCSFCFYTASVEESYFTFRFTDVDTGDVVEREVEGFYWSWGDLFTVDIENVVDFGAWIDRKQIIVDYPDDVDYGTLSLWADEYNAELYYGEDDDEEDMD